MKKGLSILLVAAALFGFYGGAANLNDVLACKDYWEKAGEESTANMNKLEDGLNQLKENEQAYLDGKDQVADGEVALADAEKQLADGEAKLADGRAELAKGEADYAAAPGKLADARRKIAKGEKDLADGKKKLAAGYKEYNAGKDALKAGKAAVADGEKKLAAAEDQLAQGEKELAAGKQQVADGEVALEEGQASLDKLDGAIKGVQDILDGYNEWKTGYEKLKKGRHDLFEGSSPAKEDLAKLAAFLPEVSQAAYVNAVNDVAGDDEKQTADDYKQFIKSTNTMVPALEAISSTLDEKDKAANALKDALTKAQADALTFAGIVDAKKDDIKELAKLIAVVKGEDAAKQFVTGVDTISGAFTDTSKKIEEGIKQTVTAQTSDYMENGDGPKAVGELMANDPNLSKKDAIKKVQDAYVEKITPQVKEKVTQNAKDQANNDPKLTGGEKQLLGAVSEVAAALDSYNEKVNGKESAIKNALIPGLKKFNEATKPDKDNVSPIDKLTAGQDQIADGVSQICAGVLGNEQLKEGVEKNLGKDAIKLLTAYQNSPGPLSSKLVDFAKFEAQMDTNPDLVTNLTKAKALLTATKAQGEKDLADGKQALEAGKQKVAEGEEALAAGYAEYEKGKKDLAAGKKQVKEGEPKLAAAAKQLAKGEKDLAAGKKKLADGKAQYAQGLKDYKAAPAKLADGRRQLAEGEAQLQDGYQAYEQGKQDLADGKAKLAEYEDGEQQVRDGLKTLTETETDLDLQSILDRLNGDDDFDNGDKHLELDEGLAAVEVGRGYQADDGVLISDEIMARAVGTGALLGAGVLAVLAAILSFLKKNKGAGVFAILAAAAGAFGAFYGTQAGTYFSSIAGSTVGATGWIAAGILGAVALVHAIAHFTAKKEA